MNLNPFNINTGQSEAALEVRDIAEQILIDQARWLDETMRKLLTPKEYDICVSDKSSEDAKLSVMARHRMQLVHDYEVMGLTVTKNGKPVARFRAQFVADDGRKVYAMTPEMERQPYGKDAIFPLDRGSGMK